MSRGFAHPGPTGTGKIVKLLNNLLCGVQAAALAEMLALAEKEGVNVNKAMNVVTNGAPGIPLVKVVATRMTTRDYTVNFSLNLMEKDLKYALTPASRSSTSLRNVTGARDLFHFAAKRGLEERDFSAVIEALRAA